MRRRGAIAGLLAAAFWAAEEHAGRWPRALAAELTPKQLALLVLRILAYDRNARTRAGGKVASILVVYLEGNQGSELMHGDLLDALHELAATVTVNDMRVETASLAYSGVPALEAKLAATRPVVMFVCTGLNDAVPSLAASARKRSVLTMATSMAYVKAGLSIALTQGEERVNIAINLPASRAEGADLDAALLRIAEVYR